MNNYEILYKEITKVNKFFYKDEKQNSIYMQNTFTRLIDKIYIQHCLDKDKNNKLNKYTKENILAISSSISNILLLVYHIKNNNNKNKNSKHFYDSIIGLHIKYFHFEIRSAMDYIAKTIHFLSNKKTAESYNDLLKMSEKGKYNDILPKQLIEVLKNSKDWFDFTKTIRDQLSHFNGGIIVFGHQQDTDSVIFNIHKLQQSLLKTDFINKYEKILNYNSNDVIFFHFYFSLILTKIFNLLEQISCIYIDAKTQYDDLKILNNHFGIYLKYSNELLKKLEAVDSE